MPNLVLNRSRYNLTKPMQTAGGRYNLNDFLYAWYQFETPINTITNSDLKDLSGNLRTLTPMPSHGGLDGNQDVIHTHRPLSPVDIGIVVPQGFSKRSAEFSNTILQYKNSDRGFSFVESNSDLSFSISAWIKLGDANNTDQVIASKASVAKDEVNNEVVVSNSEWWLYTNSTNDLVFRITTGDNTGFRQSIVPSGTVANYRNKLTNIVAVYDASGQINIYINGSIPASQITNESQDFPGMSKGLAKMTLGALQIPVKLNDSGEEVGDTDNDNDVDLDDLNDCNEINKSFSGSIAEIAFWNTALNKENCKALYGALEYSYLVRHDSGATQIGLNISGEAFDEQRQGINIRDVNDQTTSLFVKIRPIADNIKTFRYKDVNPVAYNDEISSTMYLSNTTFKTYDLNDSFISNFGDEYKLSDSEALISWFKMGKSKAEDLSRNKVASFYRGNIPTDDFIWPKGSRKYTSLEFSGDADRGVDIGPANYWNSKINQDSSGDISISLMIKPTQVNQRSRILSISEKIGVTLVQDGSIRFFYRYTDSPNKVAIWTTTTAEGQPPLINLNSPEWYHVFISYSASDLTNSPDIYVNTKNETGKEVVKESVATVGNHSPAGEIVRISGHNACLGRKPGGSLLYAGNIADVAIWNKKLSEESVKAIYQSIRVGVFNEDTNNQFISRVSVGGEGNLSSRVSHVHEDLNLGQSLLYEDGLPFYDTQNLNPEYVVKTHPYSIELPPTLADYNSLSSFDGVIDVMGRRKYIDRSTIEQPFRAKGVRGSFGAVDDTYRRSAEISTGINLGENQVVENFLDSPGQIHLSTIQLESFGSTELEKPLIIKTPGFAEERSDTFGKITPFIDAGSDRDKDYLVFLDDQELRNVLTGHDDITESGKILRKSKLNPDSSKINNYKTHDRMSLTGREYENNPAGVDSFAFGGLKK